MRVKMRKFHIGDVLTVVSGLLLSQRGMEGVYDILGYMTGEELYTHQLPRAASQAKPFVLSQYPQLSELEVPSLASLEVPGWVQKQAAAFGEWLPLSSIPEQERQSQQPLQELMRMVGPEKVIVMLTE
jgi:hypothetical protein